MKTNKIKSEIKMGITPRVMFDTNTYRFIIDGVADQSNSAETYRQIRQWIIEGKIDAFLSETLFTIEAIRKKDRLSFMSTYQPKVSSKEKIKGSQVSTTISLGPSEDQKVDFNETGPLGDYYKRAMKIGFKVIRLPRIGWITNAEVPYESLYQVPNFNEYFELAAKVSEEIEERGGGMAFVENILIPYKGKANNIISQLKLLLDDVNKLSPDERERKIEKVAKAFAEMSDGDSVASSIGLGCCAFCTNDKAKESGEQSVMSDSNVVWLKEEYGFNKMLPTELVAFLIDKLLIIQHLKYINTCAYVLEKKN